MDTWFLYVHIFNTSVNLELLFDGQKIPSCDSSLTQLTQLSDCSWPNNVVAPYIFNVPLQKTINMTQQSHARHLCLNNWPAQTEGAWSRESDQILLLNVNFTKFYQKTLKYHFFQFCQSFQNVNFDKFFKM